MPILLALVFWVMFSILGFWLGSHNRIGYPNASNSEFTFLNSSLDNVGSSNLLKSKDINLEDKLNEYINNKKLTNETTHVSVYYRNLNNGNRFGINEKEEFSPASLMKLPLMITYLKMAQRDPTLLNLQVMYEYDPLVESIHQNIVPAKQLQSGNIYTIDELLTYMIEYSDNRASSVLEGMIEPESYKKTFTDIGISFPSFKDWNFENNIRVVDYSAFFRKHF